MLGAYSKLTQFFGWIIEVLLAILHILHLHQHVLTVIAIVCVIAFAMDAYRQNFLRAGEPTDRRGRIALFGLAGLFVCAAIALEFVPKLTINTATVGRVTAASPWSAPEQRVCFGKHCGKSGPDVDPNEFPELVSPDDIQRWSAKNSPDKRASLCSVTRKSTSASGIVSYLSIRMANEKVCERFFAAAVDAVELFPGSDRPSHGELQYSDRYFRYTPRKGYRGTDSFSFRQCERTGTRSCITLRYTVEIL